MIKPVVAVYDAKLGVYQHPVPAPTKASAIREFAGACQDSNSKLNKHAEDFTLFHLADYDDEMGTYKNLTAPVALAQALEFKNAQQ